MKPGDKVYVVSLQGIRAGIVVLDETLRKEVVAVRFGPTRGYALRKNIASTPELARSLLSHKLGWAIAEAEMRLAKLRAVDPDTVEIKDRTR